MGKLCPPPMRFWIGTMVFMTTFTNYMLRSNMSVSIIGMVGEKNKTFKPACGTQQNDTSKKNLTSPVYDWDQNQSGDIMAAYFWGYMVMIMPAGALSGLIGPWHVILWSSLAGTILTALTPLSAEIGGAAGVIVNRFFVGFFGALAYPALNDLVASWAPPKEKGRFVAAMMGNTLGTVVTFNVVALTTAAWGWEWGFYILVFFLGVYCLVFAILVTDTPEKHRWTSEAEKNYILESQEGNLAKRKVSSNQVKSGQEGRFAKGKIRKYTVAPYFKMLKSVPFWAMCVAQFGNLWGLNLVLTYAPKFMAETLGFNIKASAGLAALPYIARLIFSNIFGFVGDRMRKKNIMSVTKIRKFFIIFSHLIPAAMMVLIGPLECRVAGVVTVLVLNQGFNGAVVVSHLVNAQDLTPNFAGACYGVMNFIGMTTGMFVPVITGSLNTYYGTGFKAATIIFSIGAIAFAVCGGVFILIGSGDVQPWNKKEPAATETQPTRPERETAT